MNFKVPENLVVILFYSLYVLKISQSQQIAKICNYKVIKMQIFGRKPLYSPMFTAVYLQENCPEQSVVASLSYYS